MNIAARVEMGKIEAVLLTAALLWNIVESAPQGGKYPRPLKCTHAAGV